MAKLVDPDSLTQDTEVVINTTAKTIQLLVAGNLYDTSPGSSSGVTLQCIYSFLKEEWKTDTDLNKFKFPIKMYTKTDGTLQNSWDWADAQSRQLVRDGGWTEITGDKYAGIVSLGNFDENTDQAYYQQVAGYSQSIANFDKTGSLNESIEITGLTSFLKLFLRIRPKIYSEYDLVDEQGLSLLEPILYKLPLANSDDTNISATDITVDTTEPYVGVADFTNTDGVVTNGDPTLTSATGGFTSGSVGKLITIPSGDNAGVYKIVTYTDGNNVDVDRNFEAAGSSITFSQRPRGIKINYLKGVGFTTWVNSHFYPAFSVVQELTGSPKRWFFTVAGGTSNGSDVDDDIGVVWVAYDGEVQMGSSYYCFNRIIDANGADKQEIYDWMQRQLRTTGVNNDGGVHDINANDSTTSSQRLGVSMYGNLAELLGEFVGETLKTKGGLGIKNFDTNTTNDLVFRDITVDGGGIDPNTYLPLTTSEREFPFVAAGNMNFSVNLVDEPDADTIYTMYFTTNPGGNFDTENAIIVHDNDGIDITGPIDAAVIPWDFDYTNNNQGGRTPNEDADITIVAQGLNGACWVVTTFTITALTGQIININADDERNYSNP